MPSASRSGSPATDTATDTTKRAARSFKVMQELNGQAHGRYGGNSPYQAANKAFSEIVRNKAKAGDTLVGDYEFYLMESTKGCNRKVHHYVGTRVKLETPVSYTVNNGQVITKEYKNVLRKVKRDM